MQPPRSPQVTANYKQFKYEKQQRGHDLSVFNLTEEIILREFNHWLIIENRFPYDNMTNINHLLVPRRNFADWTDASPEEQREHEQIRQQLVEEQFYDAAIENFPRAQSVTRHVHIHLIRWKETPDGS